MLARKGGESAEFWTTEVNQVWESITDAEEEQERKILCEDWAELGYLKCS